MKAKLLIFSVLLFASCGLAQAQQTQVIAHQGFWNTPGAARNSIASLVKADSIGCYGSEFDTGITTDGQIVVNHDETFRGVIQQAATSKVCTSIRLDNGEYLPLLKQYAEKAKELNVRLILELKPHKTFKQETRAAEEIVRIIKEAGLEKRTEYISFSRHAVKELIRLAPKGSPVYYLNGDIAPQVLKAWGCAGADYRLEVWQEHPEWIKECHDLGMKVNVWVVDNEQDLRWLIDQKVDFITTDNPLLLQKLLKEKSNSL